jgi:hypothetical protein
MGDEVPSECPQRERQPEEDLPEKVKELYGEICWRNGQIKGTKGPSVSGFWDVFAWRDEEYLFIESKGKDKLGPNQPGWLEAALDIVDLSKASFAVVTWLFK